MSKRSADFMFNYLKKNKSDPNKIIQNFVASEPNASNQSSSNSEYEKISADVDNSSIINTLNSVELQPRELTQEVNFVYDVLDRYRLCFKIKNYYYGVI